MAKFSSGGSMNTQAVEDYLKAIYELQREETSVATTALAERLGVRPASATGMIKRLAEMNLVFHEPYRGVVLTDAGSRVALEVIRHHRLAEVYLAEALGVPWDRVHVEAEKWEHVLSEDVEDRMDAALGHPTNGPHGQPIPAKDGTIAEADTLRLADLEVGWCAVIAEVNDHNPGLLRSMADIGLVPKAEVRMMNAAPFEGPLTIRVGRAEHAVGREVASHVYVSDVKPVPQVSCGAAG